MAATTVAMSAVDRMQVSVSSETIVSRKTSMLTAELTADDYIRMAEEEWLGWQGHCPNLEAQVWHWYYLFLATATFGEL